MPNLKEDFSLQKSCNKANESDKRQENDQEKEDKYVFRLHYNEEECEGNAEDIVWLQCGKCNFRVNVYCILDRIQANFHGSDHFWM